MASLKFYKGKFSNLSQWPLNEGAIWITTDTHQIFLDYKNDSDTLVREEIGNAGIEEGIAYGENTTAIGSNVIAGRKVYYLEKIDFTHKKALITATKPALVVEEDLSSISTGDDTTIPDASLAGKYAYIIFGDDAHIAKISSQSNNLLIFSELPVFDTAVYYEDSEQYSICVPSVPSWGSYEELGPGAVALGYGTIAAGKGAFAAGRLNQAEHNFSTAFGNSNQVRATGGFASGVRNQVEGYGSIAVGYTNIVDDSNFAGAMGHSNSISDADNSFAFGAYNDLKEDNSIALGNSNSGTGGSNTLIGNSLIGTGYQIVIGQFNEEDEANEKAFIIGAGDSTTRKTVMSVDREGNIDSPTINKINSSILAKETSILKRLNKQGFNRTDTSSDDKIWNFENKLYEQDLDCVGFDGYYIGYTIASYSPVYQALKLSASLSSSDEYSARLTPVFTSTTGFSKIKKKYNFCSVEYMMPYDKNGLNANFTLALFIADSSGSFDDSRVVTCEGIADGVWHTAVFDTSAISESNYFYNSFRLDFIYGNTTFNLALEAYIKSIGFFSSNISPCYSKLFVNCKPAVLDEDAAFEIGSSMSNNSSSILKISNTGDIYTGSGNILAKTIETRTMAAVPYWQFFEKTDSNNECIDKNSNLLTFQGPGDITCANYNLKFYGTSADSGTRPWVYKKSKFPISRKKYFRFRYRAYFNMTYRKEQGLTLPTAVLAMRYKENGEWKDTDAGTSISLVPSLSILNGNKQSQETLLTQSLKATSSDTGWLDIGWTTVVAKVTNNNTISLIDFSPVQKLFENEWIELSGFGFFDSETDAEDFKDITELMGV